MLTTSAYGRGRYRPDEFKLVTISALLHYRLGMAEPRRRPKDRKAQIASIAAEAFSEQGYPRGEHGRYRQPRGRFGCRAVPALAE